MSIRAKNYICVMYAAPNRNSLFIVNFITGISDGLILPFAACIIAYPHFAHNPVRLTAIGIAVALIGGLAYGLARFLGEREEIRHNHPQIASDDAAKEIALMTAIGIDVELTQELQTQMEQERKMWLKEVEENEMGWERYDEQRALKSGLHTASGFFCGGVLLSLPFLFLSDRPYLLLIWVAACYLFFGRAKANTIRGRGIKAGWGYFLKGTLTITIALIISFVIYKIKGQG